MAGEQKGKAYEAFTKAVLERLVASGSLKGDIFWDQRPETMTIVPDLTVGDDEDHPTVVFLVTHSGSAKESEKKGWRNIGELAEEKVRLPTKPRVFNLIFDSVVKENLKKAQAASFDGQLVVGDLAYGNDLQKWIETHLSEFPRDKDEKVGFIKSRARRDATLKRLLDLFEKDLRTLSLKKPQPVLEAMWDMERTRKPNEAPVAKKTSVRRGMSKLLIFEDADVALRLFTGKRVRLEEVPDYAFDLGLARRAIGKASPADEEIMGAATMLGPALVTAVLAKAPLIEMAGWFSALRNVPHLNFMGEYVATEHASLCDPKELERRMVKLHADPEALVAGLATPDKWPPANVWLIEFLMELVKFESGNSTGFGYSQLAREVADPDGPAASLSRGDAEFLLSPWGHLSEWLHRVPDKPLPSGVIKGIAIVLSKRLEAMNPSKIRRDVAKINEAITKNILESKVCTYSGFDPNRLLIETAEPGVRREAVRSCFGERAALDGQATKTTVLRSKHTIINWQSCSDAGRDHKKKELCGRAVALRYSWDASKKEFVKRPGIKKLILVVDGTWRQGDLDALARAGWDEIFYPDQMEELKKAIV